MHQLVHYACNPVALRAGLIVALLCVPPGSIWLHCATASDLQRSTDQAAIKAKRVLCIALNQGGPTADLKKDFLSFYEGKIVSASRLHPPSFSTGQIGPLPSFKVLQVQGPNEMLVSVESFIFKLRNMSTADVADDQILRSTNFFLVSTTETYNTVAGATNTVYVLEPARDKMPQVKPTRIYPWYNRKDEEVITGEFKTIDGPNAVFLVREQESTVPLTKFTPGDRALMRILMDEYPQDTPPDRPQERPRLQKNDTPAAIPVGID
jgi:hypothetical protein